MARQSHTPLAALGTKGSLYTAGAADLPMTAADAALFEQCTFTGKEIVIAHNSHAADPYTVTIESVASAGLGRTGDITTYSLAAGDVVALGPFAADGWRQTDGTLHWKASNASILFAVLRIP